MHHNYLFLTIVFISFLRAPDGSEQERTLALELIALLQDFVGPTSPPEGGRP